MKKVLITGANSFIGMSFEHYVNKNYSDAFSVDTLDMKNQEWINTDFSAYDVVFHVAGIAHSDSGKIPENKKALYYAVNTDLTIETAKKAKSEGVKQFIFMSSAIVYGESSKIGKSKMITADTETSPANCYGDSKLQAEKGLLELEDDSFEVVILRPPMIYGEGCRGNYRTLSKYGRKLILFPDVSNTRSMLYIDNLSDFICLMIKNEERGIFHPQNKTYCSTSQIVKAIATVHNRKIYLLKGFTWALKLMSFAVPIVDKAFGSLAYDMKISEYKDNYRVVADFYDTIIKTGGVL